MREPPPFSNVSSATALEGMRHDEIAPPSTVARRDDGVPSSRERLIVRRSFARERSGTFAVDLLGRVEQVKGTFAVTYEAIDGEPIAELLVSDGNVCYVVLAEGQIPLGKRLIQRDPGTAGLVREALARARVQGTRLGEALAALGTLKSNVVRETLLDQIVDGIRGIATAAEDGFVETWAALPSRKVPSALTDFSAIEVYRRAIPELLPARDDVAARFFRESQAMSGTWALFAREGEMAIVVDVKPGSDLGVQDLADLSRLAGQLAAPPSLREAGIEPQLQMMRAGGATMVWVATAEQMGLAIGLKNVDAARAVSRACLLLDGTP